MHISHTSLCGRGLRRALALSMAITVHARAQQVPDTLFVPLGKGRILAAGEAAMFSAQRSGPQGAGRMGFNEPTAPQNAQFVLNVLHWLSGLLPAR